MSPLKKRCLPIGVTTILNKDSLKYLYEEKGVKRNLLDWLNKDNHLTRPEGRAL